MHRKNKATLTTRDDGRHRKCRMTAEAVAA